MASEAMSEQRQPCQAADVCSFPPHGSPFPAVSQAACLPHPLTSFLPGLGTEGIFSGDKNKEGA